MEVAAVTDTTDQGVKLSEREFCTYGCRAYVLAWEEHQAVVKAAQDELSVLSERQREFLRLVAKGFERGEASRLMGVSLRVLKKEAAAIKEATGLTQTEAIVLSVRAEWV
jgi:DNA-binding NarL/FixJ family response regulator